jgi:hypothetical protein
MPLPARRRTALVTVLGAVVAVLLPLAPSPAQAADSGIATRVVLVASNPRPTYGEAYTITGQVQLVSASATGVPQYTPFPKQPVTLDLCTSACGTAAATWQNVASATTGQDAEAKFAFPLVARGTAVYRVVFDGSKYLGIIGSSAAAIKVGTWRRIALALKQPQPGRFVLRGRVNPLFGSQPVSLLRKKCPTCGFRWAQNVTTSPTGWFTFRLARPKRTSQYVVRARAGQNLEMTYSKIAQITVR